MTELQWWQEAAALLVKYDELDRMYEELLKKLRGGK